MQGYDGVAILCEGWRGMWELGCWVKQWQWYLGFGSILDLWLVWVVYQHSLMFQSQGWGHRQTRPKRKAAWMTISLQKIKYSNFLGIWFFELIPTYWVVKEPPARLTELIHHSGFSWSKLSWTHEINEIGFRYKTSHFQAWFGIAILLQNLISLCFFFQRWESGFTCTTTNLGKYWWEICSGIFWLGSTIGQGGEVLGNTFSP